MSFLLNPYIYPSTCSGSIISTTSLQGYWKFENNVTETASGRTTTPTGVSYQTGKYGQAAYFSGGASSYATVGATTFGIASAFSIGCWFKNNGGVDDYIFHKDQGGSNRNWQFGINSSGQIYFGSFDTVGNFYSVNSTATTNDNNWHFVMNTFSTTNGTRMYLDGVQVATQANTATRRDVNISSYIGTANPGSLPYLGLLDEVQIWSRELTSTEVTTMYNSSCPLSGA